MAQFTVDELRRATGGELRQGEKTTPVFGVSTDSRKIIAGGVFLALNGENFDGHDFAAEALAKGAAGLIVSRPLAGFVPQGAFVIEVRDTLRALQDIARYHRLKYNIPVIAVTGSNGKTTTKDLIAAVLSAKFVTLKTEANYNNEIGLPLTLLSLHAGHEIAVVEMGMRALGEIKVLAEIALPNIAVVTNVGETHMELLGSVENIARAKAELVEALDSRGLAVLNGDDPLVRGMAARCKGKVVYYGTNSKADVWAEDIKVVDGGGTAAIVHAGKHRFSATLPVPGRHNMLNAMAAIAVGLRLGLSEKEMQEGLSRFTPTAQRMDILSTAEGYKLINDVYNASPLSMRAAVDTLADVADGRKIAVLGDMLELGEVSEAAHRQIGGYLAEKGVSGLFAFGGQAAYIAEGARQAGRQPDYIGTFDNMEALVQNLREFLRPGDTVLIKGSRGMRMERVSKALLG